MARVFLGNLAVELTWEVLLGIEKESHELRQLARRRLATHAVVIDNQHGTRTAGLIRLADLAATASPKKPGSSAGNAAPDTPVCYALAGLLTRFQPSAHAVLIHCVPHDPANAVFIALRDGRPVHDRVLALAEAWSSAQRFAQTVDGHVAVLACVDAQAADSAAPLPILRTVTLGSILESATREQRATFELTALRDSDTRRRATTVALAAALPAALALAVFALWPNGDPPAAPTAPVVDPLADFLSRQKAAMQAEPLYAGAAYAAQIQQLIKTLSMRAGGWRAQKVECDTHQCKVVRRRVEGTFNTLLKVRANASIQGMNKAIETLTPAAPSGAETNVPVARAVSIPSEEFYRNAGARLQKLKDFGMHVDLPLPQPLVPASAEFVARHPDARFIYKGRWRLGGDLVFLDSVAGAMARSSNMIIDRLDVTLHESKPVFSAEGAFYVH